MIYLILLALLAYGLWVVHDAWRNADLDDRHEVHIDKPMTVTLLRPSTDDQGEERLKKMRELER